MGLSLSRIYQSVSSLAVWGKDKEVRLLMVGLDSAGKTTILYRLQVSLVCSLIIYWKGNELMIDWRSRFYYSKYVSSRHGARRKRGKKGKRRENRELTGSNWLQCRDGLVQEYQFPSMGSRWSIEYSSILEMLLCKHTGKSHFPESETESCPRISSTSLALD